MPALTWRITLSASPIAPELDVFDDRARAASWPATSCISRRALRAAGLPVGPGARAARRWRRSSAVGVGSRDDLYWTLHAVFVNRRDQRALFDQCFHIFWRDPQAARADDAAAAAASCRPSTRQPPETDANRRVAEAFAPEQQPGTGEGDDEEPSRTRSSSTRCMTWSRPRAAAGARTSSRCPRTSWQQARREIERLRLPIMDVPTRRFRARPARVARIDMRAHAAPVAARRRRRHRPRPQGAASGAIRRWSSCATSPAR